MRGQRKEGKGDRENSCTGVKSKHRYSTLEELKLVDF